MSGATQQPAETDRRSPAAMLGMLGERVTAEATVRRVFGEPVTAHGRTVIPVARIGYGFGAGGGRGGDGGGGAGLGARPAGALEITPQGTRFVAWPEPGRLLAAAAFGLAAGLALARRRPGWRRLP
jgi:uncharacterized spore protein YtfJ